VQEAMDNRRWISDIRGALSAGALIDFLHLWEALTDFQLHPDIEDRHIFSIAPDGNYSAKVAYEGLFLGSCSFLHHKRIWKSWMPPKCHFFLWLVAHNRPVWFSFFLTSFSENLAVKRIWLWKESEYY
jgi:hypothetical protein